MFQTRSSVLQRPPNKGDLAHDSLTFQFGSLSTDNNINLASSSSPFEMFGGGGGDRSRDPRGGGGGGPGPFGLQPYSNQPQSNASNSQQQQQGMSLNQGQTTPQPPPGGVAQPPLLLNNLAQHLNNPSAPTAGYGSGQNAPASGGKLLLLPNGAPPPAGSEEEKIYHLITELLDPDTRETALLELSKKREMYEDLALVLWGGFGESRRSRIERLEAYLVCQRYNVVAAPRDRQRLSCPFASQSHSPCFESGLQCPGLVAVRCQSF